MKYPIQGALDRCADLLSEASPNQFTDPKSEWARRRSIRSMNKGQLSEFALNALKFLEYKSFNSGEPRPRIEKIRAQTRERVRRHRAKLKR